jgi:hypothetical protein
MNSTMREINRWIHLKHEFNYDGNKWIHLFSYITINEFIHTRNSLGTKQVYEVIYTQKLMIKWFYLLHEFKHTMKSCCLVFDEFIDLRQSMIRWTHLKHEFNYKENQWTHVFSHIIINECISTMNGHEFKYYVSFHLFWNIFVHNVY